VWEQNVSLEERPERSTYKEIIENVLYTFLSILSSIKKKNRALKRHFLKKIYLQNKVESLFLSCILEI